MLYPAKIHGFTVLQALIIAAVAGILLYLILPGLLRALGIAL